MIGLGAIGAQPDTCPSAEEQRRYLLSVGNPVALGLAPEKSQGLCPFAREGLGYFPDRNYLERGCEASNIRRL